jgi:hypothetical protein
LLFWVWAWILMSVIVCRSGMDKLFVSSDWCSKWYLSNLSTSYNSTWTSQRQSRTKIGNWISNNKTTAWIRNEINFFFGRSERTNEWVNEWIGQLTVAPYKGV